MRHKELTKIINTRFKTLEDRIKSRPQGGDFNGLRKFLSRLTADIQEFESLLDELEWRMPS
ncbi:hypothetical protein [Desulfobacter sp. UBA2225]|uniref:hypothetical protein n=1 Tax=Desulfobacter sp. UBA2225 TaxID=1961413 RepID=UPI00257A97B7|nr:hypothetical protein [Desulfobacter sp. UBA2225]